VDNDADILSFAAPTMMGVVRRQFRDHGWAVKVPPVQRPSGTTG
jgi:RNA polymerase sigma-B factor